MFNKLAEWLIRYLLARSVKYNNYYTPMGSLDDKHFPVRRYYPFYPDDCDLPYPWWLPFNIFLHNWSMSDLEGMHDHPRWSITFVIKGNMIEETPWKKKDLKAGSFVFRSPKCIHRFDLVSHQAWTLFIVSRRKHKQNLYKISPVTNVHGD